MTSLELLASTIYHERQQPGSALCAQHALNNLLQGSYFSAPDLSDLARNLDLLEQSYRQDARNDDSMNMDDTGFFSVQVIENALKVWGLSLVRWRSEEMRPYHDRPHGQLAFILNLEQHWFTLRRFGKAEPNLDANTDDGHWFNLNSFLPSPERVGKLYLGMVLEQSEAEGYSVFAVVQSDPAAPLALPRTDADMIASTISGPDNASSSPPAQSAQDDRDDTDGLDGFEEEDFELQAALQASLAGNDNHDPSQVMGNVPDPDTHPVDPPLSGQETDPVRASIERNRLMLQHMREQQEYAQREALTHGTGGLTQEQIAAQEARREARRRQEEEEEENIRRAIAESEEMAKQNSNPNDGPRHPVSESFHDDDDAGLQAALRASLEQANGVQAPDARRPHSDVANLPNATMPSIALDIDELRKKRLAKFGS